GLAVVVACLDEAHEQRMWLKWFRLELRVELAAQKVWVIGDFHDLYVGSIRSGSGDPQASAGEKRLVFAVELVAVAVTLADFGLSVCGLCERVGLKLASPRPETHSSA